MKIMNSFSRRMTLLIVMLSFHQYSNAQSFTNGDFEDISCPDICDFENSTMDCVPAWSSLFTSSEFFLPVQKSFCPDQTVCSGNYSVALGASTGGIGNGPILTSNPYFGMDLGDMPQIITLKQNVEGEIPDLGVSVQGRHETYGPSEVLGFNHPNEKGVCEDVSILVKPTISDYEFLYFSIATSSVPFPYHGGDAWKIVVDDIAHCGKLFNISEKCGDLYISMNNDCNPGLDLLGNDLQVFSEDGTLIASRYAEYADPTFEDFIVAIPENGTYSIEITLFFEGGDGTLGDYETGLNIFEITETFEATSADELCCELFTESDFTLIGDGTTLTVTDFEIYADFDATHEWVVYRSPNPSGGPYTLITTTTSSTESTLELYDATLDEYYYTVVHTVSSACGENCSARVQYQGGFLLFEGEEAKAIEAIDGCHEISCLASAPEISFNRSTGTLTWTATSPVDRYIVKVYWDNFSCCGRRRGYFQEFEVSGNSLTLLTYLGRKCVGFVVGAYCNETDITWSGLHCYYFDRLSPALSQQGGSSSTESDIKMRDVPFNVNVSPNPSNGEFTVNVTEIEGASVSLSIFDTSGKHIGVYKKANVEGGQTYFKFDQSIELEKGIYFFVISSDSHSITEKIVIH